MTSVGEQEKKLESLISFGEIVKWYNHFGRKYYGISSKNKNKSTIWPSDPTSGYISKKLKSGSWRDICTSLFTAELFSIAKRQTWPKCASIDGVIHEMWSVHIVECYSVFLKGGNSPMCCNMGEPQEHYTKWYKPVTRQHILYDSTYRRSLESSDS